jgi:hypothetical protein
MVCAESKGPRTTLAEGPNTLAGVFIGIFVAIYTD